MNKYEFTQHLLQKYSLPTGKLIDIGCRDGVMRKYLDGWDYLGVDVDPTSAADKIVDICEPTAFRSNEFGVALALDVVEHTDNIHKVLQEIMRISQFAIVAVPNLYTLGMRLRFISGRSLCGKYALTKENAFGGGVRHRWLFTLDEAIEFMKLFASEYNFELHVEHYFPPRGALDFIARAFPKLASDTLFFVIKKRPEALRSAPGSALQGNALQGNALQGSALQSSAGQASDARLNAQKAANA